MCCLIDILYPHCIFYCPTSIASLKIKSHRTTCSFLPCLPSPSPSPHRDFKIPLYPKLGNMHYLLSHHHYSTHAKTITNHPLRTLHEQKKKIETQYERPTSRAYSPAQCPPNARPTPRPGARKNYVYFVVTVSRTVGLGMGLGLVGLRYGLTWTCAWLDLGLGMGIGMGLVGHGHS